MLGSPVSEHIPDMPASAALSTMEESIQTHLVQLSVLLTILLVFVLAGVWVVGRFRDRADEDQHGDDSLLTNVREMHSQGDIDDEEYRTIKTALATTPREELNHNGGKG